MCSKASDLSTNVIEKAKKKKTARFSYWKTHPIISALVQGFWRTENPHLRTREVFMSHTGTNFSGFSTDSGIFEMFQFSTVFHTQLTLHSKRFSSLIKATLKPSTGSSFKLLYSKANARTADEFMFVLLWISQIYFDCDLKILLFVSREFLPCPLCD